MVKDSPGIQCKVILNSKELPRSSSQWTRARKCKLSFSEDRLHFLDFSVRYGDVEKATIHVYQSALMFEYGIFSLQHHGETVFFGIKYDDFWKGDLPFPVERVKEETPFLLVRKSVLLVMILYVIWQLIKMLINNS